MKNKQTIALIGNPNCGKTTLFNGLTGSNQRIGNWPGVTVEKKEGEYSYNEEKISVVDLPGIYSLTAGSEDERIAGDYIHEEIADIFINIIDASNIERNLYLTTQLIEMNIPLVLVLNKMDMAEKTGVCIDVKGLSELLGIPVIGVVATDTEYIVRLKDFIAKSLSNVKRAVVSVEYNNEIEDLIEKITADDDYIMKNQKKTKRRWDIINTIEGKDNIYNEKIYSKYKGEIENIQKVLKDPIDVTIADNRYGFIQGILKTVVVKKNEREVISDKLDRFFLNRVLGIPLFFLIMFIVFWLTINLGGAFIDFFDIAFGTIFVDGLSTLLNSLNVPEWINVILSNGIGAGIQTIATFIPIIFAMFFFLSILEDSGYMARAAFVMDRFMRMIGLPGKAFVPMLIGFGCTVPAIMATRTLEEKKDRLLTVFMAPFMSCGARLPVYVIFAAAFFKGNAGFMVFSLYIAGIIIAILTGLMLKKTVFKGEASHFIMELPYYHMPRIRHIMYHTWLRLKVFIYRAGISIIIIVSVLSVLNSLGTDGSFGNEDSDKSVLALIGRGITPIFTPMGIESDNWPATVGIFTGIFAKEAVVGTLNSLYSQNSILNENAEEVEDSKYDFAGGMKEAFDSIFENLSGLTGSILDPFGFGSVSLAQDESGIIDEFETDSEIFINIRSSFSKGGMQAYAYLLFILLYFPCVAAFAVVLREIGTKPGLILAGYTTLLAWIVATLFYQVTIGHSVLWISVALLLLSGIYLGFKTIKKI